MNLKVVWGLLKQTYSDWSEDKAPRLGAALAYYTIFSLSPLLVVAIAIAGLVFGQEAAQGQIVGQIRGLVGDEGAQAIQDMIRNASRPGAGIVATVIGAVTLLLGAAGVFGQLKDSLNTIWEVEPKPGRGVPGFIKERFFSFTLVLGTGFLLLVSLVISAALSAVGEYMAGLLPGGEAVWQVVNLAVSFLVITLLFALLFKYLPDVKIAWGDVWIGAAATALLFTLGRSLLGLYLGRGTIGSAYGAAGSLVIVLLWVYYSAQILFFGAEFTQVYANRYGSRVVPEAGAVPLTEEARAQQGIPSRGATRRSGRPAPAGEAAPRAPAALGVAPNGRRRSPQRAEASERRPVAPTVVGAGIGLIVGAVLGTLGMVVGILRLLGRRPRERRG